MLVWHRLSSEVVSTTAAGVLGCLHGMGVQPSRSIILIFIFISISFLK